MVSSALVLGKLGHDLVHVRRRARLRRSLNWWSNRLVLVGKQGGERRKLAVQLCEMRLRRGSKTWRLSWARHLCKQPCKICIQPRIGRGLRVLRHVISRHCAKQLRQTSAVQRGNQIGDVGLAGR